MTIDFENETSTDLGLELEALAGTVITGVLDYMKCPYETQVSILLTDAQEIHRLNLEHRGVDRPTDVLSFPMTDFQTPGDFDALEDDGADCFDPDSGELMLGDIVLCADRILEQAEEYGHSVKREYAFLITHSMLHLMGYDHMTDSEAARMEQLQEDILNQLHILR